MTQGNQPSVGQMTPEQQRLFNQIVTGTQSSGCSVSNLYPNRPIVEDLDFDDELLEVMEEFKEKDPWQPRGYYNAAKLEARLDKFLWLNEKLAEIMGINPPTLLFDPSPEPSFKSNYNRLTHTITMIGRPSVITYLHEFAHAMGENEIGAVRWSCSLFKRIWPDKWEKLTPQGHTMVLGEASNPDNPTGEVTENGNTSSQG
ncbi:MAG: hypothetical protein ACTSQ8_23680 [Candidatus Helarchaeota archaeon]